MTDIPPSKTSSRNMAAVKDRDTQPEIMIRRTLHRAGFRFRLHVKDLPGKPDIVLPKYNAVIFVNGCFWHKHDCRLFKLPATRSDFWAAKLTRNAENDRKNIALLTGAGRRVCVVWGCAMKGKTRLAQDDLENNLTKWLKFGSQLFEIKGQS